MVRLSELERVALAEFATRLRGRFGDRVARVVLFGSRARGEGRFDSDLDLLIQINELIRSERRAVQDLAFDVGLTHGLVLSPVVVATETWVEDLPLAREIRRDGVAL